MQLVEAFRARFAAEPVVFWAPGRVNLIGEHIDYCGGRVLPMPIQYGIHAAVAITQEPTVHAVSHNTEQLVCFATAEAGQYPAGHWGRYVVGAVDTLAANLNGRGLNILVEGDVPGSGLSSSASLTVALLSAIAGAVGSPWLPLELALAAQRIEHDYVGVSCGLMDQAVIAAGVAGAAYLFDCATDIGRAVRLPSPAPELLVIDTGKRRALVHSAYNERLAETERAAQALGVPRKQLATAATNEVTPSMDVTARRRLRHVASEQRRVDEAVTAIGAGDWVHLGELFDASHLSLRDDFEVSCHELDTLVRLIRAQPGCLGARMTGAGFGGSVVALVTKDEAAAVLDGIAQPYERATGLTARAFAARSLGGVRHVHG